MAQRDDQNPDPVDWWTQNAPPPAPAVNAGPIPTNPDGSQVGGGTPWAPGASAPSSAPPGYHWDASLAMFVPDKSTQTGTTTPPPPPPLPPAPLGVPTSGFGAAPPIYASDPNAPQFEPPPDYVPPTWTGGDYTNPTEADLLASPGYQSRLDTLIKGKTRGYAAQGTALNGGTLVALDRAGQDYASNEYQNLRANTLENYKLRYGQFQDAAGMDLNARTINANQNQQTFLNRTNTYNTGNARTLSDFLTNATGKRNSELDYWNRLQDVNNTGANLAGGSR